MDQEDKVGQADNKIPTASGAVDGLSDSGVGVMPQAPARPVHDPRHDAGGTDPETVLNRQNEYLTLLQQTAVGLMNLNLDAVLEPGGFQRRDPCGNAPWLYFSVG